MTYVSRSIPSVLWRTMISSMSIVSQSAESQIFLADCVQTSLLDSSWSRSKAALSVGGTASKVLRSQKHTQRLNNNNSFTKGQIDGHVCVLPDNAEKVLLQLLFVGHLKELLVTIVSRISMHADRLLTREKALSRLTGVGPIATAQHPLQIVSAPGVLTPVHVLAHRQADSTKVASKPSANDTLDNLHSPIDLVLGPLEDDVGNLIHDQTEDVTTLALCTTGQRGSESGMWSIHTQWGGLLIWSVGR